MPPRRPARPTGANPNVATGLAATTLAPPAATVPSHDGGGVLTAPMSSVTPPVNGTGSATAPEAVGYTITGRVFEARSKRGIGGLVVTAYHLNAGSGLRRDAGRLDPQPSGALRLGTVPTREGTGTFTLIVDGNDIPEDPATGWPTLNLAISVAAPDDETGSAVDKVLYASDPPRHDAGRNEHFEVALSGTTIDKFALGVDTTAKASLATYKEGRQFERDLATGMADFHKTIVVEAQSARARVRDKLMTSIMTDPKIAQLPGVVVAPNEPIGDKVHTVATNGVARANNTLASSRGVPVNLYLTPDDRDRLAPYFANAVDGVATIPEKVLGPILFRSASEDSPGAILINQNPIAKYCAERTFEEQCAQQHTGMIADESSTDSGGSSSGGAPNGGAATTDPLTESDLSRLAARLLADAPNPDSVLDPSLGGKRPDRATVENAVDQFTLKKGPADVASYTDFHSLQIAFDHVWKILMDEDLVGAAAAVDAKFAEKTGVHVDEALPFKGFRNLSVGDLVALLPQEIPPEVSAQFDITLEEWTDLAAARQTRLLAIARDLDAGVQSTIRVHGQGGTVTVSTSRLGTLAGERRQQELREQGERLIDSVRHDDYYTLHQTLRDLHDRMTGNYEFTVFAADQNTQAVNFGLLNTWQVEMDPTQYQVGRLVSSVPMAPKEVRNWNTKVTQSMKQVRKEALKNNSSITNEQSSTARAEAEIMKKAQSKTNFGLSTDGSYNIGISKGKATTTFGVEAQSESAENRKDFREALLKAVQEYKEEHSVEVETEQNTSSESTASGTIVNPNDELSVTYLFYELQRRYRVSERLYRVMPVVLVAQDVPAPHQITEAWVIANDWVINRVLLDDSFRPALRYLAQKSVGDDFALRELRKNLRQQRNLVETLRVELSIASNEAENRYRALESSIEKRIGEESAEDTDGWFSDVGDFFGGGGQSPEAAKARELAAKDAHQYAVEKQEKAAAALRQEVGALHGITKEYNDTLRARLDEETMVKRLLVHIRNNILHYMQAIWSMEQPDQRFLRMHKVQVPVVELAQLNDPVSGETAPDRHYAVQVAPSDDIFAAFRAAGTTKHAALMAGRLAPITDYRALVEVADLDSPLGCKGNYMIFPLKSHNALTEFMAAPYIDAAFGAMDPDQLANVNLEDYSKYVCTLHDRLTESEFEATKPLLKKWLADLLGDPLRNGDEVTVPTDSLFIEILPGSHPLLEDFKLRHRELDVFSAAEDVRRKRLENYRMAGRLINGRWGDPDVEKQIVVTGTSAPGVVVSDI